jgi:ABC-2 type transport system permease protein
MWNPVWTLGEIMVPSPNQATAIAEEDCSRPGMACRTNTLIRFLPSIMVGLLYIALLVSSSMLFNSLCIEKENRAIEVLMASLHPRQLLAGKTIALGLAGLAQTIAWLGAGYFLLNRGGNSLHIPDGFTFPTDILVWSLLLFLGGYFLYASLMAGAGALVPRLKEAGSANTITLIPLVIGYVVGFMAPLAQAGEDLLPLVLSLFPLTAPVVMVMRLTNGAVALWQVLLSVGLTFLTALITLRAAGNIFRAQNLLSGQPFSMGRYLRAMTGRI